MLNEFFNINYSTNRITVSARELYEFLEVSSKYNDWIKRMFEYGFHENIDYRAVTQKKVTAQGNSTTYIDHEISLDMAKEIAMIQRSEKGKQARQYFIEVEKQWNSPERVIARGYIEATKQLEILNQKMVEMKPKVIFADAVCTSEQSILIGQLAKLIKQNGYDIGQNRLFLWLRDNGYLIKKGQRRNQPTQKSMDMGLFEVKERIINNADGSTRIILTTKVTGKGQIYFVNKFCGS